MKILQNSFLWLCLLALAAIGCGKPSQTRKPVQVPVKSNGVTLQDLEERADGLMYKIGGDEPYTGTTINYFPNGKKELERNFRAGLDHGISRQWGPDGRLVMRQFWESGNLGANLRDEQARKAEAIFEERQQLDKTVWRGEEMAQIYEDTFVRLWDDLRAAKDPLAVLGEFPIGVLKLGKLKEAPGHDWNILASGFDIEKNPSDVREVASAEWPAFVDGFRKAGVKITETEWHQTAFEPDGPSSRFGFVIHASRAETRYIVRGKLLVEWSATKNPQGLFIPRSIDVSSLNILQRTGQLAFDEVKLIDSAKEHPERKRAPATHPILSYDLDRDGRLEIIVAGANLVYWNRGDKWERGWLCKESLLHIDTALIADFTGDGIADLFATSGGRSPVLYEGGAEGTFDKAPRTVSAAPASRMMNALACTAGDINGDGHLDIWLTQYRLPYVEGQMPTPYFDSNDGWPAYLLMNDGEGNFADETVKAGLAAKRHRRTYSTSFVDLNDDHHLDLVVINDFAGLDVYHNDGHGRFTDVTDKLGENRHSFGMSHALADFNRDRKIDLFMTGMGSTTARRLEHMQLGREEFPKHQLKRMKLGYGNRLYLGTNEGTMRQPDWNHAVARSGWSWGCTAFDFDNDGDEDIYIANGHMSRLTSKDYCTTFWRHDIYTGSSKENTVLEHVLNECKGQMETISWNGFEHNVLFMNEHGRRAGAFVNVAWLLNLSHEYDSRCVLGEDLDGDGRPDLLVSHIGWEKVYGEKPHYVHVLKNQLQTGNNWIGVQLHEHGPGRSPVGAQITVRYSQGTSVRQVVTGDSWRAQHSNQKHFGLGTAKAVESVEVRWPDGTISSKSNPAINKYHEFQPK